VCAFLLPLSLLFFLLVSADLVLQMFSFVLAKCDGSTDFYVRSISSVKCCERELYSN
jgi:hypothetical protein